MLYKLEQNLSLLVLKNMLELDNFNDTENDDICLSLVLKWKVIFIFRKYFLRNSKIIMIQKNYIKFKSSFLQILIYALLINSPNLFSSVLADDKKSLINSGNFEDVFFKNDIKYEDKDNLDNQINSFFGIEIK